MKILNLQDVHGNPKWIDEFEADIRRVCEVGKAEKVDAICIAGDWLDRQMKADDSDCWDRFLQAGRDLLSVAPVFFVRGTPSHDSPGVYASFIRMGWKEVGIGKSHTVGDTLIMGLPEINSAFIHNRYPELTKQEGVEQQYELTESIISDFYVPFAHAHKGPVHFMMHGHVSGTKFRDDQKPRSTDFMFSEEMLSRIGADYYQAGHIHLTQSFKTIYGGYGGSMHITWNDVNFIPGFNVVDYPAIPGNIDQQRFDFGKPMRQKFVVNDMSEIFNMEVKRGANVHVEIKCDKEFHDQFDIKESEELLIATFQLAPLSKITTTIQHEEHTRVDLEEYEAANTTEDIYKIYNPEVKKTVLQKVKIAEESTSSETASIIPRTFEFLDMELKGSIINYENGVDRIFVDYSHFKLGANLFTGGNGKGKSFINGLTNPFSCHLPDESNLKDLFVLKNSSLIRRFRIIETDEIITQKILVDPTLSSKTAKFYMSMGTENIAAENGNKDPFDEKVTEIFGSIKMFMACVFRAQKDGAKTPSLEKAKESDLRDIFQKLSGIGRKPLKDFAHDQFALLKRKIDLDEKEIEVLQSIEESKEGILSAITDSETQKNGKEIFLDKNKESLESEKLKLSGIESVINENRTFETQVSSAMSENTNLTADISMLDYELGEITEKLGNISQTRSCLDNLKKVQTDHTTASAAYFEAQGAYNKLVQSWQKEKDNCDEKLKKIAEKADKLKSQIKSVESTMDGDKNTVIGCESENKILSNPCEKCGEIPSNSADETIKKNKDFIEALNKSIYADTETVKKLTSDIENLKDDYRIERDSMFTKPIEPENISDLKKSMDTLKPDSLEISRLEKIIDSLKSSEDRKSEIETYINQTENRIKEISSSIEKLKSQIKLINKIEYEALKINISTIENNISVTSGEIGRLTAEIEALRKQLIKCNEREEKIKTISHRIDIAVIDKSEWLEIEMAFSPKGIPAMELSLIAPSINKKANEFLQMHSNRFNVDIITQDLDSKNNIAEKFKILVHDTKGAEPKNLPVMSGGQLSWIISALQEAISYIHAKRSGRAYTWSIMDESDSTLDTEIMADYYDMMDRAMDNKRKLVSVSHSPIAKSMGLNTVNVEDFFEAV